MIDSILKHKKQIVLNLLFSVFSIATGCVFYLLSDKDILFFKHFDYLSEIFKTPENTKISIPPFIRNYLCDMCWSFSLESTLYLLFIKNKRYLIISVVVSSFVSITMEILQGFNIVSGTFDPADIILEIVAVFAAGFILNIIWED